MILRLEPPIALETPKGKAYAHFLIDYALDEHLFWVCFQDETGECWTWKNTEIKIQNNRTVGRELPIKNKEEDYERYEKSQSQNGREKEDGFMRLF